MTVYINIGSNQGDRRALIERAVALVSDAFPGARIRRAPVVESAPWGYFSASAYLNLGAAIDLPAPADPHSVLARLQAVETTVGTVPHRNPDGSYRDRDIDIDIIAIDSLVISTPSLTVPHPRASLRPFVMEPLRQLAPAAVVRLVEEVPNRLHS